MNKRALLEAILACVVVTCIVTVGARIVPEEHAGTFVGLTFLGAVWWLVWRKSDARVTQMGLSFSGLVLPGRIEWNHVAREAAIAILWALALATLIFVPFYFGWMAFWKPHTAFSLPIKPFEFFNTIMSQIMLVALPEEAFYRGYLQTRLTEAFAAAPTEKSHGENPRKIGSPKVLESREWLAMVVVSLVFAIGHYLTRHSAQRLAVFFPSLLFGWLRARTKGTGASIAFHVMCNLFSEALFRGYGMH